MSHQRIPVPVYLFITPAGSCCCRQTRLYKQVVPGAEAAYRYGRSSANSISGTALYLFPCCIPCYIPSCGHPIRHPAVVATHGDAAQEPRTCDTYGVYGRIIIRVECLRALCWPQLPPTRLMVEAPCHVGCAILSRWPSHLRSRSVIVLCSFRARRWPSVCLQDDGVGRQGWYTRVLRRTRTEQ